MNNQPLTVRLCNGVEVLAKLYAGKPSALTYANATQANRAAARLGQDWTIYKNPRYRPFYVARVSSMPSITLTPEKETN
jgi:hypothetical protein